MTDRTAERRSWLGLGRGRSAARCLLYRGGSHCLPSRPRHSSGESSCQVHLARHLVPTQPEPIIWINRISVRLLCLKFKEGTSIFFSEVTHHHKFCKNFNASETYALTITWPLERFTLSCSNSWALDIIANISLSFITGFISSLNTSTVSYLM